MPRAGPSARHEGCWGAAGIAGFTDACRRELGGSGARSAIGRVSHLRIDPEIERNGSLDASGALRTSFERLGWRPAPFIQPETTRLDDLRADEGALWGDLRKKWRQSVHRARAAGVTVIDDDGRRLADFYRIYRETADRAGFLIRAESAYRDAWEAFGPQGRARLLFPAAAITAEQRQRVIDLKHRLPTWGAQRLKRDFDLALSEKAIRRIWHQENWLKRKRRKHRTKQDLRAVKAQWRLFEQTCLDTKDLIDIPELWPQLERGHLPKVQYTAREVVTGLQFIAFAGERALVYSALFAELLLAHLQRCGVAFQDSRFQPDNGSEFIGAWNARDDSAFTKTVASARSFPAR